MGARLLQPGLKLLLLHAQGGLLRAAPGHLQGFGGWLDDLTVQQCGCALGQWISSRTTKQWCLRMKTRCTAAKALALTLDATGVMLLPPGGRGQSYLVGVLSRLQKRIETLRMRPLPLRCLNAVQLRPGCQVRVRAVDAALQAQHCCLALPPQASPPGLGCVYSARQVI